MSRGNRDRPSGIPGRFVGRIAKRVDGCALNLLGDPAWPEIPIFAFTVSGCNRISAQTMHKDHIETRDASGL